MFSKSRFGVINAETSLTSPTSKLSVTNSGFLVCNRLPSSINRSALLVPSPLFSNFQDYLRRKNPSFLAFFLSYHHSSKLLLPSSLQWHLLQSFLLLRKKSPSIKPTQCWLLHILTPHLRIFLTVSMPSSIWRRPTWWRTLQHQRGRNEVEMVTRQLMIPRGPSAVALHETRRSGRVSITNLRTWCRLSTRKAS